MAIELNPRKLNELPNVREHHQKALAWLKEQVGEFFLDGVESVIDCREPFMESPIEAIFYGWFEAVRVGSGYGDSVDLWQQVDVTIGPATYRLDFAVKPGNVDEHYEAQEIHGLKWPGIGVEVDGHDFHERTKEQVAYRNSRDRALQAAGWTIFHFSGSELHNKPAECAQQVFDHSWKQWIVFHNDLLSVRRRYFTQHAQK